MSPSALRLVTRATTLISSITIFTLVATALPATAAGSVTDCTISGTVAADVLTGTEGDDIICGGAGDDTIYGLEGNDTIRGGDGLDVLYGGDGNDSIDGGNGTDALFGQEGDDTLTGGNGADKLDGAEGVDSLNGGNDADVLQGGGSEDLLHGGDGVDVIDGGPDADQIYGDNGGDTIYAGFGADTLWGGRGNDALFGGPGDDLIDGEQGDDSCDGGTGVNTFASCATSTNPGGADPVGEWADADSDGTFDAIELRAGTNPLVADSDGDGLSDGEELMSITDPTKADSDGNGIADGSDDPDRDDLTTSEEIAVGTSAGDPDTDHDFISDGVEVAQGTNPLSADTDADGLFDAQELTLGTDATNADSDGDGSADGAEIFTRDVIADSTPATFEARGTGLAVLAVSLEVPDDDRLVDVPGQRAPPVEVLAPIALESGTLSIPFDTSGIASTSDIVVLHFDDEEQTFDVPVDQTIDLANGIAIVTTFDFSPFVVVNISEFMAIWQAEIAEPRNGDAAPQPIDVVFVIDSSGSQLFSDPSDLRLTVAKSIVDTLLVGDRVGVVEFDETSLVSQTLTTDFTAAKAAIDRTDNVGWRSLIEHEGLNSALNELGAHGDPDSKRIIILLSDGNFTNVPWMSNAMTRAVSTGTIIHTIGIGLNYDVEIPYSQRGCTFPFCDIGIGKAVFTPLLTAFADMTGGIYYRVTTPSGLPLFLDRVGEELGAPDADGDGLADVTETEGWRDGSGRIFHTDPNDADTDDDELSDGDEAGRLKNNGPYGAQTYYAAFSDPTRADSDRDTLGDAYEVAEGLSAWRADYDYDGLNDAAETQTHSTEPFSNDTDVDGYLDKWETEHEAEGFDPLTFDPTVTPLDYVGEFARGALCGDILAPPICEPAGLAFLIGNIAAGVVAIGDIRDAIANVVRLDFISAALSVAALIPIVGDIAGSIKKYSNFIKVADAIPSGSALRGAMKDAAMSNADKMKLLNNVAPNAAAKLKAANIPDDVVVRMASRMISAKHFDDMVGAASSIKRAPAPGTFKLEKDAEALVRANTPGALPVQILSKSADGGTKRFYDVLVQSSGWADEIKLGRVSFSGRAATQLANDMKLLTDPTSDIKKVTWQFFSNGRNTLGPDAALLQRLKDNGIDFILWVP